MNSVHLHLMLNHLPVLGTAFGVIVLFAGFIVRSKPVALVGLVTSVLTAIASVPVYLTGEPAEEVVEALPGIAESAISQHENAAFFALGLAIISGLVGAVAIVFVRSKPAIPAVLMIVSLGIGTLTAAAMAWTANLGGGIRHTEISQGGKAAQNGDNEAKKNGEGRKKDDDD